MPTISVFDKATGDVISVRSGPDLDLLTLHVGNGQDYVDGHFMPGEYKVAVNGQNKAVSRLPEAAIMARKVINKEEII